MVQKSYGKGLQKSYGKGFQKSNVKEFPQIILIPEEFIVSFLSLLVCCEEYSKKEDSDY